MPCDAMLLYQQGMLITNEGLHTAWQPLLVSPATQPKLSMPIAAHSPYIRAVCQKQRVAMTHSYVCCCFWQEDFLWFLDAQKS